MNNINKEINTLIMQEIGLDIGPGNRIFDQDTGMEIKINGMDVIAPGCYCDDKSIEFDPYNNRRLMGQLFSHFLDKYSNETDLDVLTYYNVDSDNKSRVECLFSDNSTVSSKSYNKDSLKYTDIIIQLNGGEANDLNKYDLLEEKESIKRRKRGTRNNVTSTKNKSNK